MSNPKWKIGPVKLVNGREAFIDAINEGQEDCMYVGRNIVGSSWIPAGWHANGRMMYVGQDSGNHLTPPPKKTVRVRRWLVTYADGSVAIYLNQEAARIVVGMEGFALFEIDREVEEGEGL